MRSNLPGARGYLFALPDVQANRAVRLDLPALRSRQRTEYRNVPMRSVAAVGVDMLTDEHILWLLDKARSAYTGAAFSTEKIAIDFARAIEQAVNAAAQKNMGHCVDSPHFQAMKAKELTAKEAPAAPDVQAAAEQYDDKIGNMMSVQKFGYFAKDIRAAFRAGAEWAQRLKES